MAEEFVALLEAVLSAKSLQEFEAQAQNFAQHCQQLSPSQASQRIGSCTASVVQHPNAFRDICEVEDFLVCRTDSLESSPLPSFDQTRGTFSQAPPMQLAVDTSKTFKSYLALLKLEEVSRTRDAAYYWGRWRLRVSQTGVLPVRVQFKVFVRLCQSRIVNFFVKKFRFDQWVKGMQQAEEEFVPCAVTPLNWNSDCLKEIRERQEHARLKVIQVMQAVETRISQVKKWAWVRWKIIPQALGPDEALLTKAFFSWQLSFQLRKEETERRKQAKKHRQFFILKRILNQKFLNMGINLKTAFAYWSYFSILATVGESVEEIKDRLLETETNDATKKVQRLNALFEKSKHWHQRYRIHKWYQTTCIASLSRSKLKNFLQLAQLHKQVLCKNAFSRFRYQASAQHEMTKERPNDRLRRFVVCLQRPIREAFVQIRQWLEPVLSIDALPGISADAIQRERVQNIVSAQVSISIYQHDHAGNHYGMEIERQTTVRVSVNSLHQEDSPNSTEAHEPSAIQRLFEVLAEIHAQLEEVQEDDNPDPLATLRELCSEQEHFADNVKHSRLQAIRQNEQLQSKLHMLSSEVGELEQEKIARTNELQLIDQSSFRSLDAVVRTSKEEERYVQLLKQEVQDLSNQVQYRTVYFDTVMTPPSPFKTSVFLLPDVL